MKPTSELDRAIERMKAGQGTCADIELCAQWAVENYEAVKDMCKNCDKIGRVACGVCGMDARGF